MSDKLRVYLALEKAMVQIEAVQGSCPQAEATADLLRDEMDDWWEELTPQEQVRLDARTGDPLVFAGTAPAV